MIQSLNATPQIFPSQQKTDAQKTEKFLKECVDAGVDLVNWELSSGVRKTKSEMVTLYNIVNGVIDPSDKKNITNPLNIQGFDFPGTAQTYPLITPLLSVLTGEERNRFHFFDVSVVNHDAVSQKQMFLKQQLDQTLIQGITNPQMSQEQIQAEIERIGKLKFTYRDVRERMGYQILSYLRKHLDLDYEFSNGFENNLIVGEQIYTTDIVGGEPIVRRNNSLNMTFVRSNDSPYAEDSDMIIEDGYLSLGKIIDEYHDVLKPNDVKKLEKNSGLNNTLQSSLFKFQNLSQDIDISDLIDSQGGIGSILSAPSGLAVSGLCGAYDKYGRIRRTRVLWKSMRKIGILSYTDENGELVKTIVPEQYEPNKALNEEVKWIWISEWWEGTRLGEDIYVKMGPRPVQFREMTNLSKCHPGVVGIINNVNSSKVTSFVSTLKPVQYLYDEFVYRMQTAFMTSYGSIARLDMSQIPDEWSMDKWLYYATVLKWAVQDPFKEGSEGQARGKLAGTMNQPANTFNLDQGNLIQQNMLMLQYLENRANDIAGISPQRKGSTSSRETLGGIERAVVQSSHRTEKWFSLHDLVKMRVYRMLLETAKVAWRDQKFKRTFFMDDMTEAMLDFDGEVFNEAEYGVMVNNSKNDTKIKNLIESSAQTLMQNQFPVSSIIDILRTDNLSTMQRKIEAKEEEIAIRAQESNKMALEQQERESQRTENLELEKIAAQERNNVRDNQTKLLLKDDVIQDDGTESKLSADLQKHKEKLDLEYEKLSEQIRHNKEAEKIQKIKKVSTK